MQSKIYWAACAALAGLAASPAAHAKMPLNDTGMRACVDFDAGYFVQDCTDTGQDGEFGRDVTHKKNSDGRLGFSYRKICNNGEAAGTGSCPADPKFGTAATAWGCTEDRVTGLVWEIKRPTGLRTITAIYAKKPGGFYPTAAGFVATVNRRSMCGAGDWRLPTVMELQSIVNYQYADYWLNPNLQFEPEQTWFPESFTYYFNSYMTADEKSAQSNWTVNKGAVSYSSSGHVRLVRNAR
ncbi:hypothetical protein VITFI_CDS3237 [Vitreoscilla filiformis]|uniref:Lcl C-terminal domain-containing protein n=2 Tax=Vitreoscilla filiformis TaxID=63 RepID=A0A221KIZ1_VITFI|nr:hypothetical protein VITFI_CDS3237 [Vitreoscilla filiformis]